MSWEERNVSCQQKQQSSAARFLAVCRRQLLLRGAMLFMLGLLMLATIAVLEGWHVAQAAPVLQTSAPNGGTLAIVGAGGAQLYATPGGESIQELTPGTVLTAVGRSADNLWVVAHNDSDLAGWLETTDIVLFGLEQLPVMVEGTVPATGTGEGTQPAASPQAPVLLPTPTQTPLATPTPTPSPVPTATPSPTPLPSPTPTATLPPATVASGAAPTGGESSLVAVVRGGGAALYDRPGGAEIDRLPTGTALTAWGRSSDGEWLVVVASSGTAGWVQIANVVVFNIEELAVLDAASGLPSTPESTGAAPSSGTATEPVATPPTASAEAVVAPALASATPEVGSVIDPDAITASVTVTDSRLNIRNGPGTNFSVVDHAEAGDVFEVGGRNAEATWIEVIVPELEGGYGWVAANFVTLNRPILGLPISQRVVQGAPTAEVVVVATPAAVVVTQAPAALGEISSAPTDLSGRLVFQSTNGGTIYVYDLASGAIWQLSGGFDPAISPDGKSVAFTRTGGDHGLYLIDIDGKNERRIWNGGEGLRGTTWSPDGKWIAFVRQSGAFKCRDVGFGICLPDNPFLEDFPIASMPEFNLSRVDTNGENFRDLDALNTAQAPSWHTEGIVYQASTGLEITADVPVVETKALVQAPYYQDPTWQPNGNRVLFQAREGSHWEIFTINIDGSGLAALTHPVTALVENLPSNVAPAWSPDGQWIVYLSNRDEENDAGEWRLWVMAADGSNQHPLPIDVPLEYSFYNEQSVSWGVAG